MGPHCHVRRPRDSTPLGAWRAGRIPEMVPVFGIRIAGEQVRFHYMPTPKTKDSIRGHTRGQSLRRVSLCDLGQILCGRALPCPALPKNSLLSIRFPLTQMPASDSICNMKKTRLMIQVDKKQLADLKELQQKTGASVAEIVRRAIDQYLEKTKK